MGKGLQCYHRELLPFGWVRQCGRCTHEVDEESDDDHGNQFRNVWERLAEIFGSDAMPSLEKYINVDAELGSTQQMTDAEIVDSVKNVSNDTGDVDDVDC